MPEPLTPPFAVPFTAPDRPLSGVTLLLVEDSRYASEAVRLLCLRSGARIRRADCLMTAERHLATYRPTAVLIDLGLPDGSGIDLIARLAAARPRLPAILATSAETGLREAALAAGADAFLAKPFTNLAEFQAALLMALRIERTAARLVGPSTECISPDPLAYRDDLAQVCDLLSEEAEPRALAYAARFLSGVAHSARDSSLAEAATTLSHQVAAGAPAARELARVAGLVEQRLSARGRGEVGGRLA